MKHLLTPSTPAQNHNFGFLFRDVAQKYPGFPAIVNEATVITYVQLLAVATGIAKRLQDLGIERKSIVALNTGDTPISIAVLLATSLLGCRMVTASNILAKQDLLKPTHFLRTSDAKGKPELGFIEIDSSWLVPDEQDPFEAVDAFAGYDSPDDPWLILHTSGTTGRPKFLNLTHKIVADRTRAISDDFPVAQLTCVMLFNCTSRPFFARVVGALLNACAIVDSDKPDFWKRSGVGTVFCSPGQFETFIKGAEFTGRFKNAEVSGAKLEDSVAYRLLGYFDNVTDIYGASETNKTFANVISLNNDGAIVRTGKKLDSEVEIVDRDNQPCPTGKTGTVRVRNNYTVDGYMNAPDATEKSFINGWFYPGDVGLWGPNGELNIIGRNDEIISFGGVKIDAGLIDLIIKSTDGVKDAVCFKGPKTDQNEILAFIVFEDGINKALCIEKVRENYQSHLGLPCFLGRLHEIDEIPYNENGRPMRILCQEMILSKSNKIRRAEPR